MRTKHKQDYWEKVKGVPITVVVMLMTLLVWLNTWKQWQAINKAKKIVATFEKQYWELSEENGRLKRELSSLKEPGSQEILLKRSTGWREPNDYNLILPEVPNKVKDTQTSETKGSKISQWWRLFENGGYGKMAR
jgi:hypothetical protein